MTPSEPTGRYIQANGVDIYYEEHGQGNSLLLIHGGLVNAESWQPYLAAFAEHYRVITPDSRGHGRTANPSGTMSYRLLADDMAAFVQALSLHKPLIWLRRPAAVFHLFRTVSRFSSGARVASPYSPTS